MRKPNGYWTFERCKEEALKYKTRRDFHKNSSSSYSISFKNGWLNLICLHMKPIGNAFKRCIYAWEFEDHSAYIGLTFDYNKRIYEHKTYNKSSVFSHLKEHSGVCKQLTDYLSIEKARKLENIYIENYRKNNWLILNKRKGGVLGINPIKWTKEKCKEEALKYNNQIELRKINPYVYEVIRKNKWFEFFSHMLEVRKPYKYWTYDRCKEEALKYNTKKEFMLKCKTAYSIISKNNWQELCNHLLNKRKSNNYWTYDRCKNEALKYNTKKDFYLNSSSAYSNAKKNKWVEDICEHMKKLKKSKNYWTYEKCKETVIDCESKMELYKKCRGVYTTINKHKWFELISHFIQ